MAIHLAFALTFAGTVGLALVLWAWADRIAGARLLVLFLCGVATWVVGNETPALLGGGAARLGFVLMASVATTAAVFFHFTLLFTGVCAPRWVAAAYAVGGCATAAAMALPAGRFIPAHGRALIAVPSGAGWVASAVWALLAVAGLAILARALLRGPPERRAGTAAVLVSSGWGLCCMTGFAVVALGLPFYPWPLLLLPVYPVILVYGIMRYRVFVSNTWARRAVAWAILVTLALLVASALPALIPGGGALPRLLTGAGVVATVLALAGPMRAAAERLVYPGGAVSGADLAAWRDALRRAESPSALARTASQLLSRRLGIPVAATVAGEGRDGAPGDPALDCRRVGRDWRTDLVGWDHAPPGRRRFAEIFGVALADQASRLDDAATLVDREKERQTRDRLAEIGQLALTVAHDVRNPLGVILMAAASTPPDTRAEIRSQVDRISRLSRDLLDYARPWTSDKVDLDAAAQARLAAARYPGVVVEAPDAEVAFRADPSRLDQALGNLLDNARGGGGDVSLVVEADATTARFSVCDKGPGIPADLADRVFEPFVSRSPDGTGLGLAIVARIMDAHGGSARLTKRPGWSTCVTLAFPRLAP